MPPVTPSSTRRPFSRSAVDRVLDALVVDLPLGDLLESERERLVREAALHERRHELAAPLAELVVVRVDLAGAFRGQDHQRVLGVNGSEQVVDLWFDHLSEGSSGASGLAERDASMIAATCDDARSSSSFTTT